MNTLWRVQVRALIAGLVLVGIVLVAAGLDPWWWA
jgi:hypothetical protein